jgi:hypothetical protein
MHSVEQDVPVAMVDVLVDSLMSKDNGIELLLRSSDART